MIRKVDGARILFMVKGTAIIFAIPQIRCRIDTALYARNRKFNSIPSSIKV